MTDILFLDSEKLRKQLSTSLIETKNSVLLASAFITSSGYNWLNNYTNHIQEKVIIGRFLPYDFIQNSSSFSILKQSLDNNWKIGIDTSLHSKVTIIDEKKIFLGSSNLTSFGLGLGSKYQNESNLFFETVGTAREIKNHLVKNTVFLNEELIAEMEKHLKDYDKSTFQVDQINKWPEEFGVLNSEKNEFISSDFPDINPSKVGIEQSLFFANIEYEKPNDIFLNSAIYNWTKKQLLDSQTKYTNFGWMSSLIHDVVIDSPPIKRMQAKELASNLFECIQLYSNDIEIEHHNFTKSLKLKV